MREIIFRAKRPTDNEWIFGWYAEIEGYYAIIDDVQNYHMIDIETLGQFIGLTDKNGKEIYEGDIVRLHQFLFDGHEYEHELLGIIKFGLSEKGSQYPIASYCLSKIKQKQIQELMGYTNDKEEFEEQLMPIHNFYGLHEQSFEVIGNIYDNKELLK